MVYHQCNGFENQCSYLTNVKEEGRGTELKKKEMEASVAQYPKILLSPNDVVQYLISGNKELFFFPLLSARRTPKILTNSMSTKPFI